MFLTSVHFFIFFFLILPQVLLEECPEDQKSSLQSGYNMIMDSMGERFKFFAMFPNVLKDHLKKLPVAGFPKP